MQSSSSSRSFKPGLIGASPITDAKTISELMNQYMRSKDIWEVRADLGNDAFRLLRFWDEGQLIILTNAFAKKTQKTPPREISLAEQRRADYLSRKKQL